MGVIVAPGGGGGGGGGWGHSVECYGEDVSCFAALNAVAAACWWKPAILAQENAQAKHSTMPRSEQTP